MDGRLLVLQRFIEALGEPADISSIDSRKRFQKAVYLGQLSGVDLGYRYSWYVRGPYSTALTKDYYALAGAQQSGEVAPADKLLKPEIVGKLQSITTLFATPAGVNLDASSWYELLASWHYLLKVSRMTPHDARQTMERSKPNLVPYIDQAASVLRGQDLID
ncbi:hypothetical protein [Bradyrhizobium elkanii]|uniref:hypothetical protein n=1 Tax=Bradyrhizobium elkanii TaxID=29448 RepID=UPI00209D54C4|nr:hypothetical protein [Bradyrhizobium elkanii]MCP1926377.1 uncharacterized protein YwgA [Bradyrhizobium elkanii]